MDTKLFVRKQPGGMFAVLNRSVFPTGKVYWVGSGVTGASDAVGYGRNPDAPFATLVYAETQASTDDMIYVMPGHAETMADAAGAVLLLLDVVGLKIIGLGGRTRKPAILLDGHANNYINITAADTVIENIGFKAGHADIAKAISVAAAGVEIRGCNFEENVATENFLIAIQTTAAADDLVIEGCFITTVDGAETEAIEIVGACNRVIVKDNYIKGAYSVSAISAITNPCLDMQIVGNRIINTLAGDDLAGCIDLVANSTGIIANNRLYMEDNTDCLTSVDGGNCGRAENFAANEYGEEAGAAAAVSA